LILDVLDIDQLARVSQAISQISDVIRVHRKDHRKRVAGTNPLARVAGIKTVKANANPNVEVSSKSNSSKNGSSSSNGNGNGSKKSAAATRSKSTVAKKKS
jgi:hypothetical protein